MEKTLGTMGYKAQIQPLSHFYDDYGLKFGEEGEEGDDDDDDDQSEEEDALMDGAGDESEFDDEMDE
jgi:hypothetical protein